MIKDRRKINFQRPIDLISLNDYLVFLPDIEEMENKLTCSFGYSAGLPNLRDLQELLKGGLHKYLLPDVSKSLTPELQHESCLSVD